MPAISNLEANFEANVEANFQCIDWALTKVELVVTPNLIRFATKSRHERRAFTAKVLAVEMG